MEMDIFICYKEDSEPTQNSHTYIFYSKTTIKTKTKKSFYVSF